MMRLYQCNACKAIYPDVQPDGATIPHVCALLPDKKSGELVRREGHRDESVTTDRLGFATGIRSYGAGVTPVNPGDPAQPDWLSRLEADVKKREQADV